MSLPAKSPVWNWRKAAAFALALCLFVLALLQPVATHAPVLAAIILLPVVLFGLITVPRSLWPTANFDPFPPITVRARASLFQRPPPNTLR